MMTTLEIHDPLRRLRHDTCRILKIRSPQPKPHFLGIGTQKGGTSSLYHLLKRHPHIYLPVSKEQHYFTTHYNQGDHWYIQQFKGAKAGQVRGEITPYYLFHEAVPSRIQRFRPGMLLIVLLRDPVERALSQYFHAKRHGFETLELEQALDAEQGRLNADDHYSHQKHSYVSRSRYELQLQRYEALFPKWQLLVLRSENLFTDVEDCWGKIQGFLGLHQQPLNEDMPWVNAGQGEAEEVPAAVRRRLRTELAPTAAAVRASYGFDWGW